MPPKKEKKPQNSKKESKVANPEDLARQLEMLFGMNRPSQAQKLPRSFLISAHMTAAQQLAIQSQNNYCMKTRGFVRNEPTVMEPFSSLRQITEDVMGQEKVHDGCFILVRVIVPSFIKIAVETVAEDVKGNAFRLALYDFSDAKTLEQAAEDVPPGTIIAIKSPYYRISNDGNLVLRVDNPANAKRISPSDELLVGTPWYVPGAAALEPNTANEWKDQGNKKFREKKYDQAIECYTEALKLDPNNVAAMSNIALMNLHLGDWPKAVEAANSVLNSLDPNHVKCLYSKAKSLFKLGMLNEASEVLSHPAAKENSDAKDLAKKIERAFPAWSAGKYDWNTLLCKCIDNPKIRFGEEDVPIEYCHKSIKVVELEKGLGMITTAPLKAHELVVLSKASSLYIKEEDLSYSKSIVLTADISCMSLDQGDVDIQIEQLKQLNIGNRYELKTLMHLSQQRAADQRQQRQANGSAAVASGSVRARMPSTDKFQPHNVAAPAEIWDENLSGDRTNSTALRYILRTNTFKWIPLTQIGKEEQVAADEKKTGSALWIVPSRFNHSCVPNCDYYILGNLMIIKANVDIDAMTELTLCYFPNQDVVETQFSFKCRCVQCRYREEFPYTGPDDWRMLLNPKNASPRLQKLGKFPDGSKPCKMQKKEMALLEEQIREGLKQLPKVAGVDGYPAMFVIANFYFYSGKPKKSLELYEKGIQLMESSGISGLHRKIPTYHHVAVALAQSGKIEEAQLYTRKCRDAFLDVWPGAATAYERLKP